MKSKAPEFYFPLAHKAKFELNDIYQSLSHLPDEMGVYKLTDTNLNKSYVGSSVNVRQRVMGYFYPNSSDYLKVLFWEVNPRFLKIELLEVVDEYDKLREREQYWIDELNTFFPFGLNVNRPSDRNRGCYRKEYKEYYADLKTKGMCWHLLNYVNRYLYFIEAGKRIPLDNTPLIKVGQVIFTGNVYKMTCTNITPVESYYIGPPIDNRYKMEAETGNVKYYKNGDIQRYLSLFN